LGNPPGSKGFGYKDPDAVAGGVLKTVFKPGRIVVKARGPNWPWLPAGGEDGVTLTLASGSDRYCAEFGGEEKKNSAGHLVYKKADAPPLCRELCGNDLVETPEQCDGTDSAACAGLCQSDCTCPAPVCGNDVIEDGEECDGTQFSEGCYPELTPDWVDCNELCGCCIQSGHQGCGPFPCCDSEEYCSFSPGFSVCTPFGGPGDTCQLDAEVPPCAGGLVCLPGPNPSYGACCSLDQCTVSADCCLGGTCQSGQCCRENGDPCLLSVGGLAYGCCSGQVCCNGGTCHTPESVPPGETFLGSCCGEVGSTCSSGAECCSGSCDLGSNSCL